MTFPVKAKALLTALANYLNQPITLIGDEPLASVLIGHCKIVFSLSEGGQYLLSQATVTKLPTDTRR
ncbi:MAG: hypothetical protein LBI10_07455, partial [Deltaproteobacteria bacterium]|nr:hypothetical protein [Deltaproteobacteria bacterium]